jgi:hypothetical protein
VTGNPIEKRLEDKLLDTLVRRAMARATSRVVRPTDDAILAYLAGTASDHEIQLVRTALAESPSFQQEFLAIAEDFDSLMTDQARIDFDVARGTDSDRGKLRPSEHGLWAALRSFFTHPALAYGLAAVFLALFLLNPVRSPVGSSNPFDINLVSAGERTRGSIPTWELDSDIDYLLLRLSVPIRTDSRSRFTASIAGESSKVPEVSELEVVDGFLHVVVPTRKLRRGDYTITVSELTVDGASAWAGEASFRVK